MLQRSKVMFRKILKNPAGSQCSEKALGNGIKKIPYKTTTLSCSTAVHIEHREKQYFKIKYLGCISECLSSQYFRISHPSLRSLYLEWNVTHNILKATEVGTKVTQKGEGRGGKQWCPNSLGWECVFLCVTGSHLLYVQCGDRLCFQKGAACLLKPPKSGHFPSLPGYFRNQ